MKKLFFLALLFCISGLFLFAEGDDFGFDDNAKAEAKSVFSVDIGGAFSTGVTFFF